MSFNPWNGLGAALQDANREWDVHLMPEYVAHVALMIALGYADDPTQDFEALIEFNLDLEDLDPPLTEKERHAAKQAIGTVFAANRADRRDAEKKNEEAMRERDFAPRT